MKSTAVVMVLRALLLSAVLTPRCAAVTPVEKVLELLQGMSAKATETKKQEAVQWIAYKQWCGDAESQRQIAVKSANLEIESLQADVERFDAEVTRLEEEIEGHNSDLAGFDETLKNASAQRKEEREAYEVMHQDYSESVHAVAEALKVLKEQGYKRPQGSAALVQKVKQGLEAGRDADGLRALAATLAASPSEDGVAALLTVVEPGEANAYEFQSGNVVVLLEELKGKFRDEVTALEKEEMERQHAYERLAQDMASNTAAAKNEVQKKTKASGENKQSSADSSARLGAVTGSRDDDMKFLQDLDTTCNQKSDDFDARQQLRTEEIEALEKAIAIISGDAVASKAKEHLPSSLAQSPSTSSLLQLRGPASGSSRRAAAAALLQKIGSRLESTLLAGAVARLQDNSDPFDKVKQLIQQLIDRLQEEANNEAKHKEWCDTELGTNLQTRTTKTEEVEGLHTTIEQLETDIALLKKEVAELSEAVAQLQKDMAEATKLRAEEKARNEDTIADAAGAQVALAEAMKTLKDFYGKAADANAFVQENHATQAPAAPGIFDSPYRGQQLESGNVIAFLEVIQSDFARLEKETSDAEQTAVSEHDSFMGDAQADLDAKNTDITGKNKLQSDKEVDLQTARNDLDLAQSELDAALAYYDKLRPSCLGATEGGGDGSGFSERVKRREEEVAALKEALDILSGQTIVSGPDSLYSSVDGGNRGWDVGITAGGETAA